MPAFHIFGILGRTLSLGSPMLAQLEGAWDPMGVALAVLVILLLMCAAVLLWPYIQTLFRGRREELPLDPPLTQDRARRLIDERLRALHEFLGQESSKISTRLSMLEQVCTSMQQTVRRELPPNRGREPADGSSQITPLTFYRLMAQALQQFELAEHLADGRARAAGALSDRANRWRDRLKQQGWKQPEIAQSPEAVIPVYATAGKDGKVTIAGWIGPETGVNPVQPIVFSGSHRIADLDRWAHRLLDCGIAFTPPFQQRASCSEQEYHDYLWQIGNALATAVVSQIGSQDHVMTLLAAFFDEIDTNWPKEWQMEKVTDDTGNTSRVALAPNGKFVHEHPARVAAASPEVLARAIECLRGGLARLQAMQRDPDLGDPRSLPRLKELLSSIAGEFAGIVIADRRSAPQAVTQDTAMSAGRATAGGGATALRAGSARFSVTDVEPTDGSPGHAALSAQELAAAAKSSKVPSQVTKGPLLDRDRPGASSRWVTVLGELESAASRDAALSDCFRRAAETAFDLNDEFSRRSKTQEPDRGLLERVANDYFVPVYAIAAKIFGIDRRPEAGDAHRWVTRLDNMLSELASLRLQWPDPGHKPDRFRNVREGDVTCRPALVHESSNAVYCMGICAADGSIPV